MTQLREFSDLLLNWYSDHKRDLPWRRTKIAYRIWVSEIILQQTRVAQGMDYYKKFLSRFPTVNKLAGASEDEILKIWQGLGYYSRARNMHATAQILVEKYDGQFPDNYNELIQLKGIGPYTASAIASICFGEPRPVVDGNVMRVIARYCGLEIPVNSNEGIKRIHELAEQFMEATTPGDYNQAIMELGALICVPQKAQCQKCPVNKECVAFNLGITDKLPIKTKKSKIKNRYLDYLCVVKNNSIYLFKRGDNDIWKGLYDMPFLEHIQPKPVNETLDDLQTKFPESSVKKMKTESEWHVHLLSHQRIHARYWHLEPSESSQFNYQNAEPVSFGTIEKYPVSKLTERFFYDCCFPIFVA